MSSTFLRAAGIVAVLAAVVVPGVMMSRRLEQHRNFVPVREGVLYRSAQLPVSGLKRLVSDHGIRCIVSLRDGAKDDDRAEEQFCEQNGIRFLRIPPLSWGGVQGGAPIDAGLKKFLDLMSNPDNRPALIHCFRGVHRTGGYCAVFRMEYEGWSPSEAIEEMRERGYHQIDDHHDIRGYLRTFRRTGRYSLSSPEAVTRRGSN